MSVLIKGMEMPKNHNHVTITIWSDGTASYGLYNRGESLVDFRNVEAVPVPEHGDLIDRDALMKGEGRYTISFGKEGIDVAEINRAPTIIPADEVV